MQDPIIKEALKLVEDGVFNIDPDGNVWRHKKWIDGHYRDLREPRITGSKNHSERLLLHVRVHDKPRTVYLHRLVYAYFNGGIEDDQMVGHHDGDVHNNHPSNLFLR